MRRRATGEGSFYREGEYHCWKIRLNGRQISRKAKTAGELREKVKLVQKQLEKTSFSIPAKRKATIKVADFLAYWLDHIVQPSRSHATYRSYAQTVHDWINPSLANIELTKLTVLDVRKMMNDLALREPPLSPRSRQLALVVLKVALNHAVKEVPPWITYNPAAGVEAPKQREPRIRTLDKESQRKLIAELESTRYGPLLEFLLTTGLRTSEALALQWSDIDFGQKVLRVTRKLERVEDEWEFAALKGDSSLRTIGLGLRTIAALERAESIQEAEGSAGNYGLVFTTRTGEPIHARNVTRALHTLLKRLEMPRVGLHDLRKSFGTDLARARVPLHVVQRLMGHASITTTQKHYLAIASEDIANAAKVFDD